MKSKTIVMSILVVIFAMHPFLSAQESYVLFSYDRTKYTTNESGLGGGIYLAKNGDSEAKLIWGDRSKQVFGAWFAPDGKTIAFSHNDQLYIMDNTGLNERTYDPGPNWPPTANPHNLWYYTGDAIIWRKLNTVYRYVIDEDKTTGYSCSSGDMAEERQTFRCSSDGRVCYMAISGWGGNRLFTFDETFSSMQCRILAPRDKKCPPYVEPGEAIWGHGNAMTPDGKTVLMSDWCGSILDDPCPTTGGSTHRILNIFNTETDSQYTSVCVGPIVGLPGMNIVNWDSPEAVANSNDHVVVNTGNKYNEGTHRAFIINFKTRQQYAEFPHPHAARSNNGWIGPLPKPHGDLPFLQIDKEKLLFTNDNKEQSQTVTVTNAGEGTLTDLNIQKGGAATDWLSITVSGTGNTQVLTHSFIASAVTGDSHDATVTISGGTAQNKVNYTVSLRTGAAYIPQPHNVTATNTGANSRNVSLSWSAVTGENIVYKIERKSSSETWSVVNTVSMKDYTEYEIRPATYYYRITALSGTISSEPSAEIPVRVLGTSWIDIVRPIAGQCLVAGSSIPVSWNANLLSTVKVEAAVGTGNFVPIHQGASISPTGSDWNNLTYVVPSTTNTDAALYIVDYNDEDLYGSAEPLPIEAGSVCNGMVPIGTGALQHIIQFERARKYPFIPLTIDQTLNNLYTNKNTRYYPRENELIESEGLLYSWQVRSSTNGVFSDTAAIADTYIQARYIPVYSPIDQPVQLAITTAGTVSVWHNTDSISENVPVTAGAEYITPVINLQDGGNQLLIKTEFTGKESSFSVRIVDNSQNPVTGLFYKFGEPAAVAVVKPTHRLAHTSSIKMISQPQTTNISLPDKGNFTIRLYTLGGRMLMNRKIAGNREVRIEHSQLKSGMYLIAVSGAERFVGKFLVR